MVELLPSMEEALHSNLQKHKHTMTKHESN